MYRVTEEPLSADAIARAVGVPAAGGVAVFLGIVRNETAGRPVVALEYEAHLPMAEAKLKEIGEGVYRRWPGVRQVAIVHRIVGDHGGTVEIGDSPLGGAEVIVQLPEAGPPPEASGSMTDTASPLITRRD